MCRSSFKRPLSHEDTYQKVDILRIRMPFKLETELFAVPHRICGLYVPVATMLCPSLVAVSRLLASGNSKSWMSSMRERISSSLRAVLRFLRLLEEPDLRRRSGREEELNEVPLRQRWLHRRRRRCIRGLVRLLQAWWDLVEIDGVIGKVTPTERRMTLGTVIADESRGIRPNAREEMRVMVRRLTVLSSSFGCALQEEIWWQPKNQEKIKKKIRLHSAVATSESRHFHTFF